MSLLILRREGAGKRIPRNVPLPRAGRKPILFVSSHSAVNFKTVAIKSSVILSVLDRLTIDTDCRQIVAQVEKLINDGHVKIVLHFTGDSYFCTRSITMLLHCNKLVTAQGGSLGILSPNKEIVESLETTGIDSLIHLYEAEDNIE